MRFNICIAFLIMGIIPIIIFRMILIDTYEQKASELKINEVQNNAYIISNLLSSSGYLDNVESELMDSEINQLAMIYEGRVIIVDDNFNIIKDTYSVEAGKTIVSEEVINCFKGTNNIYKDKKNQYIEMTMPIFNNIPNEKNVEGVMILTFSTKTIGSIKANLVKYADIIILSIFLVVLPVSILYSGVLTSSVGKLRESIERLSEGYMDEQLPVTGHTEVKKLSVSFNKMITKMQTIENSRQEFVSNVSHELKTPITSIKVLADSLLMQEDVPIELYREFLEDITDEIERENKIINDLLSLVKMDKTSSDLNISSLNINELLEQILKRLRPIAFKRNIELLLESFRPVLADVDEVKISLAISNLVENAIKYNIENGWVRVSLNADHKFFYIKVSDSGIGIPEESQEHIFERFYRVDKTRSRETGGTGLGLSITRSIILMHRGAIKIYSKEDEGTTFTVRIPLNYIS